MDLKKKIGPLPLWGWIVVVGGIGAYFYFSSSSSSSSSGSSTGSAGSQIDPATGMTYAQEAADQANGIDPYTGQTYASEYAAQAAAGAGSTGGGSNYGGGGGLTDSSTSATVPYPSLSQEISDVSSAVQALQGLGFFAPTPATSGSTGSTTPVSVPSNPVTGTVTHTAKPKPAGKPKVTHPVAVHTHARRPAPKPLSKQIGARQSWHIEHRHVNTRRGG